MFRPFLMLLAALLVWAPLAHAQNVLIQDDFNYKTPDIDGHAPTKGAGLWKVSLQGEGVVSTDGTQALITTGAGTPGAGTVGSGIVKVSYPFNAPANTLYTLSATFLFAPLNESVDCWAGFGYANFDEANKVNGPWILIRPPKDSGSDSNAAGYGADSAEGPDVIGVTPMLCSDLSAPVTAKIIWNSSTGETQYYINNELHSEWTKKIPFSIQVPSIFFEGFLTGNAVKIKNITLTTAPIKK